SDEIEEEETVQDEEEGLALEKKRLPGRTKAPTTVKKDYQGPPKAGQYDVVQQTFLLRRDGPDNLTGTKKICPGCSGRRGIFDVITPVSLGTSAAVKVLTEELLEALPENPEDPKKRLLVFADSRQDAAHQARFISFTARFDRMRMRVISILTQQAREEAGPL